MTQAPQAPQAQAQITLVPFPHDPAARGGALLLDLFPAAASFSFTDQTAHPARICITSDLSASPGSQVLHVFVDSTIGPAPIYRAPVLSRTGDRRDGAVTTADGTVSFSRSGGCGCGSALKAFRPFPNSVMLG